MGKYGVERAPKEMNNGIWSITTKKINSEQSWQERRVTRSFLGVSVSYDAVYYPNTVARRNWSLSWKR